MRTITPANSPRQPAAQTLSPLERRIDATSRMRPLERAVYERLLHKLDESACGKYAVETAVLARSIGTSHARRANVTTIQRVVRKLIESGRIVHSSSNPGCRRVIELPLEFRLRRGPAYQTTGPVGGSLSLVPAPPHPGVLQDYRGASVAGEHRRERGRATAHPQNLSGLAEAETAGRPVAPVSEPAQRALPTPGNSMKPTPSIKAEPPPFEGDEQAATRKVTKHAVPHERGLQADFLVREYAKLCAGVGAKPRGDARWYILQLLEQFDPCDILQAWDLDVTRCMPSTMWGHGTNLHLANVTKTLEDYS